MEINTIMPASANTTPNNISPMNSISSKYLITAPTGSGMPERKERMKAFFTQVHSDSASVNAQTYRTPIGAYP